MARPRVLVTRRIPEAGLAMLREYCDVEVWMDPIPPARDRLLSMIVGRDALLTLLSDRMDAEAMDAAGPSLKVISNFGVGYNNIDVTEANRRGIRVGNTPNVLTNATADIAMCLLLAASRNLKPAMDAVRNGGWKTWEPMSYLGWEFAGKTVGVIGGGRIGAAFARRCRGGWGTRILYHSRSRKDEIEQTADGTWMPLEQLLGESDIVSLHCPLTNETRYLMNRARFELMRPGSILINTARGEVVDQDALYWALTEGPLAAAGLDVTEPEPLDPAHPLVSLDNCVIAPHIGSGTHEARDGMATLCARNILAVLNGGEMASEVRA